MEVDVVYFTWERKMPDGIDWVHQDSKRRTISGPKVISKHEQGHP
jgi:hypothetical protein